MTSLQPLFASSKLSYEIVVAWIRCAGSGVRCRCESGTNECRRQQGGSNYGHISHIDEPIRPKSHSDTEYQPTAISHSVSGGSSGGNRAHVLGRH
jgi:hypothetical protein